MLNGLLETINKFIPDKTKAAKFQAEIQGKYEDTFKAAVNADKEIRLKELDSKGLKGKWRPFGASVVFFTYFVRYPLLFLLQIMVGMFDLNMYLPQLEPLPLEFHGLAIAFISVYSHGRTMEKRIQNIIGGK